MHQTLIRLYADPDGESHIDEQQIELEPTAYAPPAPDVYLSRPMAAVAAAFLHVPAGWIGTWHVAPRRQLFVVLSGEIEVEMSDGARKVGTPGMVALLEDTTGRGHVTRALGSTFARAVVVPLA